jgi:hypothetical protein
MTNGYNPMGFILVTNDWSLNISSLKFHINPTKALGIIMFFHLLWELSKVLFLKLISTNSQVIHFHKWKNNQSSNESHKLIIEFILLKQWNEQYAPKNVHHGLSHSLLKSMGMYCIPNFRVSTHWENIQNNVNQNDPLK